MDYEAIGVAAVLWRNAEDDKAAKRKEFMAVYLEAIEEYGHCASRSSKCLGDECDVDPFGGGQCERDRKVHNASEIQYRAWRKASHAASCARAALTRRIRQQQRKK